MEGKPPSTFLPTTASPLLVSTAPLGTQVPPTPSPPSPLPLPLLPLYPFASLAIEGQRKRRKIVSVLPAFMPAFMQHVQLQGVSSNGLKIHKGRKHENIPQVDGETEPSQQRETDCWWERNLSHCLKTYQVYRDVILDIDESSLSEEEKVSEREHVTNIRKEGLGSNYIYCPPWCS